MSKIRKHWRGATLICWLLLCAAVLAGCQSRKYEKIGIETVESGQSEEGEAAAKDGTDGGMDDGDSRAEADAAGQDVPPVRAGADSNPDSLLVIIPEEEPAKADTSALNMEITTSNGFTDVDETVYVTEDLVNVRKDCAPGSEVVTQLSAGDTLRRTGVSDSWSRVQYEEKVCFVASQYVSTQPPMADGESSDAADGNLTSGGEEPAVAAVEDGDAPASAQTATNGRIVAIDPGHQAKGNSEKEPVGPGSATMKAKVASGATGVVTGLAEYQLNLTVSLKLKRILEERGYQVVMIRESHDVNISNAERAEIANKSGANIFVRVHANSLDNTTVHGVLTMCQTAKNPYNSGLHDKSYSLSKKITDGISASTGAKNRGVQETDSMSGINWCQLPVSIVEMGFMSNPEEDRNMADDAYQEKIAQGIADGIDAYFEES